MDVFISYRREGGYAMARLVYECLRNVGLSVLEQIRLFDVCVGARRGLALFEY